MHATFRQPQAVASVPIAAYFDEAVFAAEQQRLFGQSPQYAGHERMVPECYDYHVLAHDPGLVLVHTAAGLRLLSNVCRHRQALILEGRGHARTFTCPLHRWTYRHDGRLLLAPHFPTNPLLHLAEHTLYDWAGLQWRLPPGVAPLSLPSALASRFALDDYTFTREVHSSAGYNWKAFIEVYLEDYHVVPFHPGLGHFVSCEAIDWSFGHDWSLQVVGFAPKVPEARHSQAYYDWFVGMQTYYQGQLPEAAAMWLLIYPNVMVEWYPMMVVVSTVYPQGVEASTNIMAFYHLADLAAHPEGEHWREQSMKAYLETAAEDDVIGLRMQAGRKALYRRQEEDSGPYQQPLEAGMAYFHAYLHGHMGPLYAGLRA